jgi:ABC-type dipeptide/oligopeptide/nickel transport system permease subunit
MVKDLTQNSEFIEKPPRVKELRRILRVFLSRKVVVFGIVVIFIFILTTIFAPLLAPYDPYKIDLGSSLLQPSGTHLLGTDLNGRDTLSRIIYGSRTSLAVGIIAVGLSASSGILLGLIAGYFGGISYIIIMRLMDSIMSIPMIMFALVIAAMLGGGINNIIISLGIIMMPSFARMMCGQVLSVKECDYITASRSLGSNHRRIMILHILPNCIHPLIVQMTFMLGSAILAEAGLSFLGVGISPPGAAWGSMVSDGYGYLDTNPVLSYAPGVAIMLVVFAFNMVGDGLRDALDPRLRGIL